MPRKTTSNRFNKADSGLKTKDEVNNTVDKTPATKEVKPKKKEKTPEANIDAPKPMEKVSVPVEEEKSETPAPTAVKEEIKAEKNKEVEKETSSPIKEKEPKKTTTKKATTANNIGRPKNNVEEARQQFNFFSAEDEKYYKFHANRLFSKTKKRMSSKDLLVEVLKKENELVINGKVTANDKMIKEISQMNRTTKPYGVNMPVDVLEQVYLASAELQIHPRQYIAYAIYKARTKNIL